MRKTKRILSLILSICLVVCISAVSANARNISIQSAPSDAKSFIKLESYLYTHPADAAHIAEEMTKGNTEVISQYFPDPQDQEFIFRVNNLSATLADIIKTVYITGNFRNIERNVIPTIYISSSENLLFSESTPEQSKQYTFLSISDNLSNAINIDPFFAYKNNNNELVFLGIIRNNTGKNAMINAVPHIEITSNGKLLASGYAAPFQQPMKMSPYHVEVNSGISDGLPDKCFIKMVFKPGTYDESVDISTLDHIGCSYTLDYSTF